MKILLIFLVTLAPLFALENLSLQLKWHDGFQFAGYYMAKEKGFYKDANLDVKILQFNDTINLVESVTHQNSTYAIGNSSLVVDKSKGADIVLLATLFQSSPFVLITKKSSHINSFKDMKNKKIMLNKNEKSILEINSMFYSHGLSLSDMKVINKRPTIDSFLKGETDIFLTYITNAPYTLQKLEVPINIFNPKHYGFDFYSDILFTSSSEVKNYPQRAKKFTQASLRGWNYAFNHIDETIKVILKQYNSQNLSYEQLRFQAKRMQALAYYSSKNLGEIKAEKIQNIYDFYNLMGFIQAPIDMKKFIYNVGYKIDNFNFNKAENDYIREKQEITMCVDPAWMPFESIENGKHIGMSADYMKLISKKIQLPITLVPTTSWSQSIEYAKARKCDIFSLAMSTPSRKKYMNFTDPYLTIPLVVATTTDKFFIDNIKELSNKKLGVVKSYAFTELLQSKYPSLDFVTVKDIQEGLKLVDSGELYGFIDNLTTIGYQIQKNYIGSLKITGRFSENWNLSIGVRNDDPLLLHLLNHAISLVDEKQKQKILNNWTHLDFAEKIDYKLLYQISTIFSIILLFTLYRYYITQKYNKKMAQFIELIDNNILSSSTDLEGKITNVSSALCKISGYTREELIGKNHNIFKHPESTPLVHKKLWETISSGNEWQGELQNRNKDGTSYWIEAHITPIFSKDGTIKGYNSISHDISDKKRIEKLSVTDQLTQLYNRLYIESVFTKEMLRSQRYKTKFCVIMLDIDFFKQVNDTYGHNVGDSVLVEVSTILKENIRNSDILGRWGGEEFLIISPEIDINKAKSLAEKLRYTIDSHTFQVVGKKSCSFGVAESRLSDTDSAQIIKRADDALYIAKNSGRNCVVVSNE